MLKTAYPVKGEGMKGKREGSGQHSKGSHKGKWGNRWGQGVE